MIDLAGKTILITGAGSGNGRALALGLARAGAHVIATDIELGRAKQTVQLLGDGGSAVAVALDVRHEDQVVQVVADAGPLDGLVNNAGILTREPFLEMSAAAFDDVLAVDLRGYFLCGREAAKQMVARRAGSIVNICSTGAYIGAPRLLHYVTAKAGVLNMTRAMAVELGPSNVRVNSVSPGLIPTEINKERLADAAEAARLLAQIPLGRFGRPEDLAGIVALLLCDHAGWITGADILVDGGSLAG